MDNDRAVLELEKRIVTLENYIKILKDAIAELKEDNSFYYEEIAALNGKTVDLDNKFTKKTDDLENKFDKFTKSTKDQSGILSRVLRRGPYQAATKNDCDVDCVENYIEEKLPVLTVPTEREAKHQILYADRIIGDIFEKVYTELNDSTIYVLELTDNVTALYYFNEKTIYHYTKTATPDNFIIIENESTPEEKNVSPYFNTVHKMEYEPFVVESPLGSLMVTQTKGVARILDGKWIIKSKPKIEVDRIGQKISKIKGKPYEERFLLDANEIDKLTTTFPKEGSAPKISAHISDGNQSTKRLYLEGQTLTQNDDTAH